ncbi:MAG: hypothetical protein MZV63_04120 [Marinilabiliales bacterium]|nr:hypothetical protein [Marinilabiliales bacterium]
MLQVAGSVIGDMPALPYKPEKLVIGDRVLVYQKAVDADHTLLLRRGVNDEIVV